MTAPETAWDSKRMDEGTDLKVVPWLSDGPSHARPRQRIDDDPYAAFMVPPVPSEAFVASRIKLATNSAAAFHAAAVVFAGQMDGGLRFKDRPGRAASVEALKRAVKSVLYDV